MRSILWIIPFLVCLACSKKQKSEQDENLVTGYQLIDAGRSDEAVQHFYALVDRYPSNQNYLRALGSSYSARAGFKVQNLTGPMQEIKALDSMKEDFQEWASKWVERNPNLKDARDFVLSELDIISFIRKITLVPNFDSNQVFDLKQAIATYLSLENPTQGDYLYIAVLESLLLKSTIIDEVPFINCKQFALALHDRFVKIASKYSLILHHMELSQPSKKESFSKQQLTVSNALNKLSTLTSDTIMAISLMNAANTTKSLQIFIPNIECK